MTYRREDPLRVWRTIHGPYLARERFSPDLLVLAEAVMNHLPDGVEEFELLGFLRRHRQQLHALLEDAFRSQPPPGHPADINPPRVGVLHRSMTLSEAEDAMRGEAEEHVVIVDATTGQQTARFGPAATRAAGHDPRGLTLLDTRCYPHAVASGAWILSHNHPQCGALSVPDIQIAVTLNLQSIRAVCPDGWLWWMDRPAQGWPHPDRALVLAGEATDAAYDEAAEHYCGHTNTGEINHAWKTRFNNAFVKHFNIGGAYFGLRVQGRRDRPASGRAPRRRRAGGR